MFFSGFPFAARRPGAVGGGAPVTVLSVGRAVAKKGYDDLLAALARLPAGLAWRFRHVGAGDQLPGLRARAEALGLADRITWRGALAQADVIAEYQAADLFVLPSKIAADGDRDGLPNVLMEAQALGLACLSTAVSAIPELILDGETGVLVPPGDPDALAGALVALITEPARRARLADAGAARCRSRFAMAPGIRALADRFAPLLGLAPGTTRNGS